MERKLAAILAADVVGFARLMGEDETETLNALSAHLSGLIGPTVAEHKGRIVKLMGDGLLAEFASVFDAVSCALEIQRGLGSRNVDTPEKRRIELRIGVNLGDVIVQDGDIYGDGVNVAARLEAVAGPGEICLSEDAYRQARGRVPARFEDLGPKALKNIAEPIRVFAIRAGDVPPQDPAHRTKMQQEIRYCRATDGVRIAYASVGEGPPIVKASNWMTHLEYDWQSPVWRHWFTELSASNRLIRYDERGVGLSDWDIADISIDAFVEDLEAVVAATEVDRFVLFGISQGCAISITYATRYPEKVAGLILFGGYAAGWRARGNQEEIDRRLVLEQMIRVGWGQDNPAFRQVFTTLFVPGATEEQRRWFNDLERISASPENAMRHHAAFGAIDVRPLLEKVRAPALVLHSKGDAVVPFESGRELAMTIPDARFVPLESDNHILLADEPAWPQFLTEVRGFLASLDAANPP